MGAGDWEVPGGTERRTESSGETKEGDVEGREASEAERCLREYALGEND